MISIALNAGDSTVRGVVDKPTAESDLVSDMNLGNKPEGGLDWLNS